jgi:hypothetical protein
MSSRDTGRGDPTKRPSKDKSDDYPENERPRASVAPVVLLMEELTLWVLQRVAKFPREHRFTLGDRLQGCSPEDQWMLGTTFFWNGWPRFGDDSRVGSACPRQGQFFFASRLAIHSKMAVSAPPISTTRVPCIKTPRPCSASQVHPRMKPT